MNVVHLLGAYKATCNCHLLGAKLVYLPMYSPDFNPIEHAFSALKAWL